MWLDNLIGEGAHATRLRTDLPYFAETALKLRPKSGLLSPFVFNPAQIKLHTALEAQKKKTGRVRAVILKARQLGCSTYLAARFFHRVINSPGLRCMIVGHEKRASTNLFQIVKRFYDHLPQELKPELGTSNAEELLFSQLDAGYLVSVATSEGAGRSATTQLQHLSEVAHWQDLDIQMASLLQTTPDIDGTEVVLETTALGYNSFYNLWRKAEAGESEFVPVFLGWNSDAEYRRKVDPDFVMTDEEQRLAELHNFNAEQIAWRRAKVSQLGNESLFSQEYPLTPSESFISSTFDSFIPAELVIRARREKVEPYGPLVIGVDPAGMGADRTSIAWRRSHVILKVESRRGLDTMETTGWINRIIDEEKPDRVNLDVGGMGIGIYDRLIEMGHRRNVVQPVNFGGKPVEPPPLDETGRPAGGSFNRRSEMWSNLKKALEAGRFSLLDSDSLQADLVSVGYKYTSDGKLLLESKQDMRKRGVPSPDEADAVALCFADPSGFSRSKNFNRDLSDRYQNLYV